MDNNNDCIHADGVCTCSIMETLAEMCEISAHQQKITALQVARDDESRDTHGERWDKYIEMRDNLITETLIELSDSDMPAHAYRAFINVLLSLYTC